MIAIAWHLKTWFYRYDCDGVAFENKLYLMVSCFHNELILRLQTNTIINGFNIEKKAFKKLSLTAILPLSQNVNFLFILFKKLWRNCVIDVDYYVISDFGSFFCLQCPGCRLVLLCNFLIYK